MLPFSPSCYYHLYNHANGSDDLFREEENYYYFLRKWKKYISPIADTYAYCLMPNHFHTLVRFKDREWLVALMLKRGKVDIDDLDQHHEGFTERFIKSSEINVINNFIINNKLNLHGVVNNDIISTFLSQQFSNLFNGYTKAINKRYKRYGSLFVPRFKRKLIDTDSYLYQVLKYIHLNPVSHGFVDHPEDWEYSSWVEYHREQSWLNRSLVERGWNSFGAFKQFHNNYPEVPRLKDDLEFK